MTILYDEYNEYGDLINDNEIVDAMIYGTDLAEDYADEIFIEILSLDPDRDPFGWDITDNVDWESQDYE